MPGPVGRQPTPASVRILFPHHRPGRPIDVFLGLRSGAPLSESSTLIVITRTGPGSLQIFRLAKVCNGCRRYWVQQPQTMTELHRQQPRKEGHAPVQSHMEQCNGSPCGPGRQRWRLRVGRNRPNPVAVGKDAGQREDSSSREERRAQHGTRSCAQSLFARRHVRSPLLLGVRTARACDGAKRRHAKSKNFSNVLVW